MSSTTNQEFPINIHNHGFNGLINRGFMTPTFFSKLVMMVILPATWMLDKKTNGINMVHGMHTLHKGQKVLNNTHAIIFPGNGLDGCDGNYQKYIMSQSKFSKYTFWNYPGVCASQGEVWSPHDLFEAGYLQVKNIIDNKISKPEDIIIYGFSLGGAVAANVARRLHQEGLKVNLRIDRSFANISVAGTELIKSELTKLGIEFSPLIISIITCVFFGIALGALIASLLASIGLISSNITGCEFIYNTINWIGFAIGAIISFAAIITGILCGLIFGAILSTQFLWTNQPLTIMPLSLAFSALLYSTCCEMNSVNEINKLITMSNDKQITIINSLQDQVIPPDASLLSGLEFKTDSPSTAKIMCEWYEIGNHTGRLKNKVAATRSIAS